jgi:hypothetical protein
MAYAALVLNKTLSKCGVRPRRGLLALKVNTTRLCAGMRTTAKSIKWLWQLDKNFRRMDFDQNHMLSAAHGVEKSFCV